MTMKIIQNGGIIFPLFAASSSHLPNHLFLDLSRGKRSRVKISSHGCSGERSSNLEVEAKAAAWYLVTQLRAAKERRCSFCTKAERKRGEMEALSFALALWRNSNRGTEGKCYRETNVKVTFAQLRNVSPLPLKSFGA